LRLICRHYYQNTQGLIFVVDSSDVKRIELAQIEPHKMFAEEELKDSVALILANKKDIGLMNVKEVISRMSLASISDRS